MIVAFDSPTPIGYRGNARLITGESQPYIVIREATFEEFMEDWNNEDIQYPPCLLSREQQMEIIKSKLHFYYEISID